MAGPRGTELVCGCCAGAILRAVEDLGVSGNEALRCLRSMAVSSILSRATTPLSPALYRAFDYLAAPNRLSKAAIQRVVRPTTSPYPHTLRTLRRPLSHAMPAYLRHRASRSAT